MKEYSKIIITFILSITTIILIAIGINLKLNITSTADSFNAKIHLATEQIPGVIDDRGEVIETTEYNGEIIPTVDEIDGGQFKDKDTGVSITSGMYQDLGWAEAYDTSTPDAFRDDTLNKCIIANNYYGAQCVSLARVFWWSYADRDVSTCGTGMAKGMMNCADENAGDDFLVYWADDKSNIQAGDWLVFNGGQFGHVGMALGPVVNGYVTLLGENQGGHYCEAGGSATNIINININNLIGYYRPVAYIDPEPEPEPLPISNCVLWHVERGDTMGKIMLECEGTIKYGEPMDKYAKTWYSLIYKKGQSVYDGWQSASGVGLYAGDDIEHRIHP